jgi:pyruvate/2-oxoglutarate/acetoin dehydrogenase E1 component
MRTLLAASEKLKKEGISPEVIDLQTIYPYDA